MTLHSGKLSGKNPFVLAQHWLREAEAMEPNDPNAIALATVDADGMPNVRMVLLKEIEPDGFVFYTNYESEKGREIAASGKASFVMHWKSLRRQIRVRGVVSKVSDSQSDVYFGSRSLKSRIGAIASKQSRPLSSKAALVAKVAKVSALQGVAPKRPEYWGGYRIEPLEIEFWTDGAFRLHDRFQWRRETLEKNWVIQRLNP